LYARPSQPPGVGKVDTLRAAGNDRHLPREVVRSALPYPIRL